MVGFDSYAMRVASLLLFLICAVLVSGCSPSELPPETIVLGEQVTAGENGVPGEGSSSPLQQSASIDNITVAGSLVQGRASVIGLSCMVSDTYGTVRSVVVDFSGVGGPGEVMLSKGSGKLWIWSGVVTATVAGSAMVYFRAADDVAVVATRETSVFVAASTQDDPAQPPAVTPDDPAEPPAAQDGENIAAGCSYTWSRAPNHSECTDAADVTQLTDGYRTTDSTPGITASMVGWSLPVEQPWVAITIDLGQVQPISGAMLNTVAGHYFNVDWPLAICMLVSLDGVRYYDAGELTILSRANGLPPYGQYASHAYRTNLLATHGRYVRFLIANHPYVLVDEIEVYRGQDALLTVPLAGEPVADVSAYLKQCQLRSGIARRIVLDAQEVRAQAAADVLLNAGEREQLLSDLTAIIASATGLPDVDPSTFRAVLPLNNLHAQVFAAQGRLWQAQGRTSLIAWQNPLWDPLSPTQVPGTNTPSLDVVLMQNEYRAGGFNLSNASGSDLPVHVQIQGLPGGADPTYVTVHEVAWVDTRRGVPVAAALPDAPRSADGFLITVPSGMTRQVWLTFHPVDVAPGTYRGTIAIQGGAVGTLTIPVQLRVSALRFPEQPTMGLGGWDYTDSDNRQGVTPQNRDALVAYLSEHFVDTPWATGWQVMPNPVDFRAFDAWVRRWPKARNFRIAMAVGESFRDPVSGRDYQMGTPQFNRAVGEWISAYASHLPQIGLNPNQVGLLIRDEPDTAEKVQAIQAWAAAIRAAEPGILLWQDPSCVLPASEDQAILSVTDVLCLERPNLVRNRYRDAYRNSGKTLNLYSSWGPCRWLDPYSYYRLQAWTCWQYGATAMHYWSFSDVGGASSWNEYLTSARNYSPLYLDARTVTGSKQMEAIREGIEDCEYLVVLRNRIVELEAAGNHGSTVASAKLLLAQAASQVMDAEAATSFLWCDLKDRSIADRVRVEVLDMLETLGLPGSL